jgi:hypothetical protein
MCFAGDLEIHRGTDGLLYVVDLGRVFPPQAVGPDAKPGAAFVEKLRPEFVVANPVPLNADAYTGWGKLDPRWREHNAEVRAATHRLLTEVVPLAGKALVLALADAADGLLKVLVSLLLCWWFCSSLSLPTPQTAYSRFFVFPRGSAAVL